MYALASLRCPLVSAALPVAFARQARHLVHCQGLVAGAGLGALQRGRMYTLASLRCPLVSAALSVAFAWQARDLVHFKPRASKSP